MNIQNYGDCFSYPAGRSPGFDPTHPAAQGISPGHGVSFLPASGQLRFNSLLTGAATSNAVGTNTSAMTQIGWVVGNASGNQFLLSGQAAVNETAITLAGFLFATTLASAPDIVGQATGPRGLTISVASTGKLQFNLGGVVTVTTTMAPVVVNVPFFMVASWFSGSTNNIFWTVTNLNTGQIYTETDGTASSPLASNGIYSVGGNAGTGGGVGPAMWSPVVLSKAQQLAWAADPWSFWYPRRTQNYFDIVGAAAANVVVPWPLLTRRMAA